MKFFVFKSKRILFTCLMLFVCFMLSLNIFSGSTAAAVFSTNSTTRKVPVYAVESSAKKVAISFDAAWGSDKTEGILKILKEYNAKATFFLVGFWAEEHPELVKKIQDEGMEIGLHSNSHPDMIKLSETQIRTELEENIKILEGITGKRPTLFRAPFGSYNDKLITICEDLKLTVIQWSVDSLDWKNLKPIEMTNRILNRSTNGSIILCHNNSTHILEALPIILDRLQKKGFEVGDVGGLLIKENFIIDKQGIQRKK